MTKVCHMTSAHGAEDVRIFHKECVSLARAGYEVYLIERGESYEKEGVHIVGVGDIPANRRKRILQGAKKVFQAALAVDADVYHFHDPELLPWGLKLKRKGKRVIFDSHENTPGAILVKDWLPAPLRRSISRLYGGYETFACRRLDAVITVTPSLTAYFKGINPRTVQVTNFPVLQTDVTPPTFRERRLVFAGGVNPLWNHALILQAMEQVPNCRYSLCGPADASYLRQLEAMPAWKWVDYLGKLPHKEVAQQMANASIGLAVASYNPNTDGKRGTLGNTKIFEEMMAGLPIVCTDFALWQEIVDRWHCGICVDPESAEGIAQAIRYLLDHPQEARQMGENGRRAIKEAFNWGNEERALLALYEDIWRD